MAELGKIVNRLIDHLYAAAFSNHSPAEIGRALGLSRQAVAKRKRTGTPADPLS